MKAKGNIHAGSDFDDWLKEEDIQSVVEIGATMKILSHLLKSYRRRQNLSVSALAQRMGTSRSQVNRLLTPNADRSITLHTAERAAIAMGKRLKLELVD